MNTSEEIKKKEGTELISLDFIDRAVSPDPDFVAKVGEFVGADTTPEYSPEELRQNFDEDLMSYNTLAKEVFDIENSVASLPEDIRQVYESTIKPLLDQNLYKPGNFSLADQRSLNNALLEAGEKKSELESIITEFESKKNELNKLAEQIDDELGELIEQSEGKAAMKELFSDIREKVTDLHLRERLLNQEIRQIVKENLARLKKVDKNKEANKLDIKNITEINYPKRSIIPDDEIETIGEALIPETDGETKRVEIKDLKPLWSDKNLKKDGGLIEGIEIDHSAGASSSIEEGKDESDELTLDNDIVDKTEQIDQQEDTSVHPVEMIAIEPEKKPISESNNVSKEQKPEERIDQIKEAIKSQPLTNEIPEILPEDKILETKKVKKSGFWKDVFEKAFGKKEEVNSSDFESQSKTQEEKTAQEEKI